MIVNGIIFISNSEEEDSKNIMVPYRNMEEYYRYKDKPLLEKVDLINQRNREISERSFLETNIPRLLTTDSVKKVVADSVRQAIEEAINQK